MNSLYGVDSRWIDDGSADATLDSSSPKSLSASSNHKGTPLNLMLKPEKDLEGLLPVYFELTIAKLQGSLSIGVCKADEFHPGFKLRGMLYNGGLTNGMVRLLVGFSYRPTAGDTVGVCVYQNNGSIKVAYYLNNRCLGTGFEIPHEEKEEPFLPCLQVDGTVDCEIAMPELLPTVFTRQEPIRSVPYIGEWKLVQATRMRAFGGKDFVNFALPKDQDVLVKLTKSTQETEQHHVDLEVVIINTFRTQLTVFDGNDEGEKVEVGHVTSTMMMPPLPLVAVENYIEKSLNGLYLLDMDSDERLVMKCHAAEWTCERHKRTFSPVLSYR